MRRFAWLVPAALAACACGGSPSDTVVQFVGFTANDHQLLVVRIVEGKTEKPGTRQSAILSSGSAHFEFLLVAETPYRLQYFVDSNDNTVWDGPVGQGEPSWDRQVTFPAPLHNRDTITLTVGFDDHFAELPPDFTAP